MTASSDEQYRMQKMIQGANGMSYQDAIDEEIDNALDEKAKNITITFDNNGICREIHNDGHVLSCEDRKNILMLDCPAKSKNSGTKGRYGIGSSASRALLAGQGTSEITSKDDDDTYKACIDYKYLANECPHKNCWTGDHAERPHFANIEDANLDYKHGVTKRYIGDKLKQRFTLNDVLLRISLKYNNQIKKGVIIIVIWDGAEYIVPDIINSSKIKKYECFLSHEGDEAYFIDDNGVVFSITKYPSGIIKSYPKKERPNWTNEKRFSIEVILPDFTATKNIQLKDEESIRHHIMNEYLLTMFNNLTVDEGVKQITMSCGDHSAHFEIQESTSGGKSQLEPFVHTVKSLFIPGLTVDENEYTLCCQNYDKKTPLKKVPEGDRYMDYIPVKLSIEKNKDDDISLTQENKNNVNISPIIQKVIDVALLQFNKYILKQVDELKKNILKKQQDAAAALAAALAEDAEDDEDDEDAEDDEDDEDAEDEASVPVQNETALQAEEEEEEQETKSRVQKKPITVESYKKNSIPEEVARDIFENFLSLYRDEQDNITEVEPFNIMTKKLNQSK